jgi:hypothetical protein
MNSAVMSHDSGGQETQKAAEADKTTGLQRKGRRRDLLDRGGGNFLAGEASERLLSAPIWISGVGARD